MAANSKAISARLEPSGAGQRAHDLRLGPQPEYVDPNLAHLNRVLIAPLTNQKLRGEWQALKDLVGKKGKIRSNQNLSYAGIITFGTEAQQIFESLDVAKQDAALQEVAQKIAARFETDLTGLVYHGDESAPHAHFQLRGIADDGTPLSQIVKRAALRDIQDIAAEVMGRHAPGIERGRSKAKRLKEDGEDYAATVNRSVKQLHDDLPAEIAAKENELADLEEKIAEAEAARDAAQAKAANHERLAEKHRLKAAENDEKAAKASKNAEIQEKRARDAHRDAESAAERITSLRDEETRLVASEATLRASVEALREREREAEQRIAAADAKIEEAKAVEARLQASKTALSEADAKLEAQMDDLKEITRYTNFVTRITEMVKYIMGKFRDGEYSSAVWEHATGGEKDLELALQEMKNPISFPTMLESLKHTNRQLKFFVEQQAEGQRLAREITQKKDDLTSLLTNITDEQRKQDEYAAAAAASLETLNKFSLSARETQANMDATHWAIEHVLGRLGIADQRPNLGYTGPDGDPPPVRELVFNLAAQKARELSASLTRDRPSR